MGTGNFLYSNSKGGSSEVGNIFTLELELSYLFISQSHAVIKAGTDQVDFLRPLDKLLTNLFGDSFPGRGLDSFNR